MSVLDPNVVLRADGGSLTGMSRVVRGADAVASQAATFSQSALSNQVVVVEREHRNRDAPSGRAIVRRGLALRIAGGRIVEIDILADPERLGGSIFGPRELSASHFVLENLGVMR